MKRNMGAWGFHEQQSLNNKGEKLKWERLKQIGKKMKWMMNVVFKGNFSWIYFTNTDILLAIARHYSKISLFPILKIHLWFFPTFKCTQTWVHNFILLFTLSQVCYPGLWLQTIFTDSLRSCISLSNI